MKNWIIVILSIIVIILSFIVFKPKPSPIVPDTSDSINKENTIIYDTIDSLITELIYIEKEYETETASIINQSVASDIEFFSNYLSEHDKRLLDSNYSTSTKAN